MTAFQTLARARRHIFRVVPLMRDGRVPLALKAGTIAAALLVISPLDLFGDIPVLGLFDDAALLGLLAALFVAIATRLTERNVTMPEPVMARARPVPRVMLPPA